VRRRLRRRSAAPPAFDTALMRQCRCVCPLRSACALRCAHRASSVMRASRALRDGAHSIASPSPQCLRCVSGRHDRAVRHTSMHIDSRYQRSRAVP
jgi:hypothetical protein